MYTHYTYTAGPDHIRKVHCFYNLSHMIGVERRRWIHDEMRRGRCLAALPTHSYFRYNPEPDIEGLERFLAGEFFP